MSYLRILLGAEDRRKSVSTMGVKGVEEMGLKVTEQEIGGAFCRGLCILPKIVSTGLSVGLNICGQIFNFGSERKYKIEQKQARDG